MGQLLAMGDGIPILPDLPALPVYFVHHTYPSQRYLPLYEAKMLHQFDHRWATYDGTDSRDMTIGEKADPACVALPRYWVAAEDVHARLTSRWERWWLLGWRRITNTTNERTVIYSFLPLTAAGDSVFLELPKGDTRGVACHVANLDSLIFDYLARQKLGGMNLNFFTVRQLPALLPATFEAAAPWARRCALNGWIAPRVLELAFTAWDILPLARDLGYSGPPFSWDPERRFLLRCELDAAFFHLYDIERDDVDYIMNGFWNVRKRDEKQYGEYRTKRVILEIYDAMSQAIRTGIPYSGPTPQHLAVVGGGE